MTSFLPLTPRRTRRRTRPYAQGPRYSQAPEHLGEVLVAAATEPHEDQVGVEVSSAGERVGRLERGEEALGAGELLERLERLLIGCDDVLGPAGVAEKGVLRADAGVVEAGRDRVRVGDLSVFVGEHRGAGAVKHGGASGSQ